MKLKAPSLDNSFRRRVRSGAEELQFNYLLEIVQVINLVPCEDRYFWSLESEGDYSVASIRKLIDKKRFQEVVCKGGVKTTGHLFFNAFCLNKLCVKSLHGGMLIIRTQIETDAIDTTYCKS
uniref:RNA-directed DNA polymerase, eukaryota n=1 Tax=Tanacetum cinerariifolium TaxID=118510 RepID=A0A699JNQ2_TANCI|nr:RNA-directed DNA polymerase, eukaryota [Tanacetum cinerariifolium]